MIQEKTLDEKIMTCRELIDWCKKNRLVFECYAEKQRLNKLLKQKEEPCQK